MKILISAAEASSDVHGAQLLRALRVKARQSGLGEVEAFGIGGPLLQAEGLRAVVDARELLSMGFTEVFGRLPRILRALRRIEQEAVAQRPDVVVVIDYPEFHFRLARRLQGRGLPLVYFIPPKVWVWRKKRVAVLRALFSRILTILPFEEDFYRKAGLAVSYVGNPLMDELPLAMTREEARRRLGLDGGRRVLVAMPGSRPSELKRHVELFLDSAARTARELGEKLLVLMPLPAMGDTLSLQQRVLAWGARAGVAAESLEVRVSQGNAHECLIAADAGLIKSGTSTLEAGVLGCPHAVVYRTSFLTGLLFRLLVRYRGPVGLVNLVACGTEPREHYLMREIVLGAATPGAIAAELGSLLTDSRRREELAGGMKRLRARLLPPEAGQGPSALAAQEILAVVREKRG
ncbi:MAG: lipid-A-disaccharide synthase [Oligoflexia bacterium]|nr:lipid-A-disaccharide synthase [Oligoflexia bacterium]